MSSSVVTDVRRIVFGPSIRSAATFPEIQPPGTHAKTAKHKPRTSADGINGNVEERARGAERSEALDEFAEQFVQLQRIISLYKSLIKKDIDAIETTGEQLKEIDLKLEGVWKGLQMLK